MTQPDTPAVTPADDQIRAASGMPLSALTLEAAVAGRLGPRDIGISPETLLRQARIADEAGRPCLARNLERASELVEIPESLLIETYEMLRPGRVTDPAVLTARAQLLRDEYGAERIADFIDEAVAVYIRRRLFRRRY